MLVRSIGNYLKGDVPVDNFEIRFSKDMDTIIYLPNSLSDEDALNGIEQIKKQSKAFYVATRILGRIFHLFKNLAMGFAGWARLLISLVRSYTDLKILYQDFRELVEEYSI